MVSSTQLKTLKELLLIVGQGEHDLEKLRQHLCTHSDFNLRNGFERFDRKGNGLIQARDLIRFLLDHKVKGLTAEAVDSLIAYYDLDSDGQWDLEQFKLMIVSYERNDLWQELEVRPYPGPLYKSQRLQQVQEETLREIIAGEVIL